MTSTQFFDIYCGNLVVRTVVFQSKTPLTETTARLEKFVKRWGGVSYTVSPLSRHPGAGFWKNGLLNLFR